MCKYSLMPGVLSNPNSPRLSSTGFLLDSGETRVIQAPYGWSGRIWARTDCTMDSDTGYISCITGDCGSHDIDCNGAGPVPPATLAEFTLNGNSGRDYYDVSLVDGFNVPMMVSPEGDRNGSFCATTGCEVDVNAICPEGLQVVSGGGVVACKSACDAFGSPQFCCTDHYAGPTTCGPNQYSKIFKSACPNSYSYAYDDHTSLFTCASGIAAGYTVTFCPRIPKSGNQQTGLKPSGNNTVRHAASSWSPTKLTVFLLALVILGTCTVIGCYFYFVVKAARLE